MNPMVESVSLQQHLLNINLKIKPKINHKKITQQKSPKKKTQNESKKRHTRKKQKTKLRQVRKSLRRWRFSPYKVLLNFGSRRTVLWSSAHNRGRLPKLFFTKKVAKESSGGESNLEIIWSDFWVE